MTIEAVIETADFGPYYDGEQYVTLTFRVPKDTSCLAGIWDLTPRGSIPELGRPPWSISKDEKM